MQSDPPRSNGNEVPVLQVNEGANPSPGVSSPNPAQAEVGGEPLSQEEDGIDASSKSQAGASHSPQRSPDGLDGSQVIPDADRPAPALPPQPRGGLEEPGIGSSGPQAGPDVDHPNPNPNQIPDDLAQFGPMFFSWLNAWKRAALPPMAERRDCAPTGERVAPASSGTSESSSVPAQEVTTSPALPFHLTQHHKQVVDHVKLFCVTNSSPNALDAVYLIVDNISTIPENTRKNSSIVKSTISTIMTTIHSNMVKDEESKLRFQELYDTLNTLRNSNDADFSSSSDFSFLRPRVLSTCKNLDMTSAVLQGRSLGLASLVLNVSTPESVVDFGLYTLRKVTPNSPLPDLLDVVFHHMAVGNPSNLLPGEDLLFAELSRLYLSRNAHARERFMWKDRPYVEGQPVIEACDFYPRFNTENQLVSFVREVFEYAHARPGINSNPNSSFPTRWVALSENYPISNAYSLLKAEYNAPTRNEFTLSHAAVHGASARRVTRPVAPPLPPRPPQEVLSDAERQLNRLAVVPASNMGVGGDLAELRREVEILRNQQRDSRRPSNRSNDRTRPRSREENRDSEGQRSGRCETCYHYYAADETHACPPLCETCKTHHYSGLEGCRRSKERVEREKEKLEKAAKRFRHSRG